MRLLRIIKSIILWSYDRGTWQYDVLCILILLFIFLTPSSLFRHRDSTPATSRPETIQLSTSPARGDGVSNQSAKESEGLRPQETERKPKRATKSLKP